VNSLILLKNWYEPSLSESDLMVVRFLFYISHQLYLPLTVCHWNHRRVFLVEQDVLICLDRQNWDFVSVDKQSFKLRLSFITVLRLTLIRQLAIVITCYQWNIEKYLWNKSYSFSLVRKYKGSTFSKRLPFFLNILFPIIFCSVLSYKVVTF